MRSLASISWALAMLDDLSHEVAVDLCITERVTFSPLEDTIRAPILLAEIPAEVFSEAMRDLDLVVSVSTVANDPVWLENYSGQPVLDQYWERVAVGGLDQLLARRCEILGPFCTPEAAGDRYQLTDRHLLLPGHWAPTGSTSRQRMCGLNRQAGGSRSTPGSRPTRSTSTRSAACPPSTMTRSCTASSSAQPSLPTTSSWPAASC